MLRIGCGRISRSFHEVGKAREDLDKEGRFSGELWDRQGCTST